MTELDAEKLKNRMREGAEYVPEKNDMLITANKACEIIDGLYTADMISRNEVINIVKERVGNELIIEKIRNM